MGERNTKQSMRVQHALWIDDFKMEDLQNHHRYFFDLKLAGPKNSSLENVMWLLEASYRQFLSNNFNLEGRSGSWQFLGTSWDSRLYLDSTARTGENTLRSRGDYAIIWKTNLSGVDLQNLATVELLNLDTCCRLGIGTQL